LVLASDRLSTRAIFWLRIPGGIAFSSEQKGLLAIPGWQAELDPQAIASYLRYGRLFGRRTMCRNVELLPPGRTLIYDLANDAVEERASCLRHGCERQPLTRDRLQAMGAFARGVNKMPVVRWIIALGLDSRGMAVLAQRRTNTVMRTEGMEGCMDQRVGARLAAATGFPWCFQPLKQFDIHSYVEAMRRYMYLTEGMLVPEGFPGVGPIRFAEQERLSVLQRGHGGENARVGDAWPFQVKDDVLTLQSREDLVRYVEPTQIESTPTLSDCFGLGSRTSCR
jgi:asparagine synthetase B (glutamine-hydrolysing)